MWIFSTRCMLNMSVLCKIFIHFSVDVYTVSMCVLLATPGYTPPQANFDGDRVEGVIPSPSIPPPKKGNKGKPAEEI